MTESDLRQECQSNPPHCNVLSSVLRHTIKQWPGSIPPYCNVFSPDLRQENIASGLELFESDHSGRTSQQTTPLWPNPIDVSVLCGQPFNVLQLIDCIAFSQLFVLCGKHIPHIIDNHFHLW